MTKIKLAVRSAGFQLIFAFVPPKMLMPMRTLPIIALLFAAVCLAGKCGKQEKMFRQYVAIRRSNWATLAAVFAQGHSLR
jgi:hypothetical protein